MTFDEWYRLQVSVPTMSVKRRHTRTLAIADAAIRTTGMDVSLRMGCVATYLHPHLVQWLSTTPAVFDNGRLAVSCAVAAILYDVQLLLTLVRENT